MRKPIKKLLSNQIAEYTKSDVTAYRVGKPMFSNKKDNVIVKAITVAHEV